MISVIIPIYNGAKFINEALESVARQTCEEEYEIIVIDDGSTDNSRELIENFVHPVNYFYQNNAGSGAARNRGVEISKGDFIAFLDADDCWTPTKLEKQMTVLNSSPEVAAVIGQVKNVRQNEWERKEENDKTSTNNTIAGYLSSAILIRREAFLEVGTFETESKVGETIDWFIRAKEAEINIRVLPDLVTWRRIHGDNNGIRNKSAINDYVRVLKQSIDRRRGAKTHEF